MAINPKPRKNDGAFEEDVKNAFLDKDANNKKYTDDEVEYSHSCGEGENTPWIQGKGQEGGTLALPAGQCIYMDVGCWTGNGPRSVRTTSAIGSSAWSAATWPRCAHSQLRARTGRQM